MASLDDILTALQARAEYLRKKDPADKVLRLVNQYKENKSPEGSAAYEYGKLMNEQIAKQKIDLNFIQDYIRIMNQPGSGYSPDLIKLGNLWDPSELNASENLTYNLPNDILKKVTNDLLLQALIDTDPVANAMINPTNDSDLRSSLERALSEKFVRGSQSNDNDLRSSLKQTLSKK